MFDFLIPSIIHFSVRTDTSTPCRAPPELFSTLILVFAIIHGMCLDVEEPLSHQLRQLQRLRHHHLIVSEQTKLSLLRLDN